MYSLQFGNGGVSVFGGEAGAELTDAVPVGIVLGPAEGDAAYAVVVEVGDDLVDGDAVDVLRGEEMAVGAGVVVGLAKEADRDELVEQALYHGVGEVGLASEGVDVVGWHALGKAVGDAVEEEDAEGVVVATRHVLGVLGEGIFIDTLVGIAELGADEGDDPRDVEPQHEHREGGEGAVDGVVAGEDDLVVDVDVLEHLEQSAGNEARDKDGTPLDVGVGHELVEGDEGDAPEDHGGDLDDELHGVGEDDVVAEEAGEGDEEEGEAAGDNDEDGEDEEDGDVVDGATVDVAGGTYVPDGVERRLDVGGEHDDGVEQYEEAYAEEDAAVGVGEVGVDEAEEGVGEVGTDGEVGAQLFLDDIAEVEASGYGEDDGEDGYGGKDAAVGEGGGVGGEVVIHEAFAGDHEPAAESDAYALEQC